MLVQNQTGQIEAWVHYLTTEEGLSPATVKEYLKGFWQVNLKHATSLQR